MPVNNHVDRPRLLIVDPDGCAVDHVLSVFDRKCWDSTFAENPASDACGGTFRSTTEPRVCNCGAENRQKACCVAIDSLSHLHELELLDFDVVICSTMLHDGTGLDALAYIRGIRPQLPVILMGTDASIAVEAIRSGALDFLATSNDSDFSLLPLTVEKSLIHQRIKHENDRLHTELKRSLAELAVTNQQLQIVIRQLEAMARTDELTGLYNRRWFNLALQGSWAEATRNDLPLACLMIDLDGFKAVNDTKGHHQGDELLRIAAKVIRANCREVDVPARYGGDEFCVLMGHTEPDEASMVAERLLREFDLTMRSRPAGEPRVSMSVGLSHIDLSHPVNAEQLVSHADEAMYAAKSAGKQRMMIRAAQGAYLPMWRKTA